jgi:predicted cupin superfamily sugar epimerase
MVSYTWFLLSDYDVRNTGQTTRSWSMSLFPSAPNTFALSRPGLIWDHGLDRWRSRTPRDDVSFNITTSTNIHNAGRVTSNPAASRQGQWVTLNAQANAGFEFRRFEVVSGGISFHSQSGSSATFIMPANNVSVRAVFGEILSGHTVFLSSSNFQAGTASVSPHTNVRQGDWVSLQAHANPGFEFDHWEIVSGGANIQNPHLPSTGFSMPAGEVSIRAMFRQAQGQTVSVSVDDVKRGTFSANPSSNVAPGAWVSLQANAGPGFEFERWEVISGTVQIQNLYSAATGFPMPDGEVSVRAVFRPIAPQAHSVTVSVSDGAAGTAGASPNFGVTQGSLVNLQADANPGFEFARWEVVSGEAAIQNLASAATSFVMTGSDVSVRAVFNQILMTFSVTASVDDAARGSAHATPSTGLPGANVALAAQANPGFAFSHWEVLTNNAVIQNSNSASASFIMPGDNVTVMAFFIDDQIDD